jgi:hypothetical protein
MLVHGQVSGLDPVPEEVLQDRQHHVVVAVVVLRAVRPMRTDEAEPLELLDPLPLDPRRRRHLVHRHLQPRRWLGDLVLGARPIGLLVDGDVLAALLLQQPVLDHLERQVLVPLHPQDVLQSIDVLVVELSVPGGSALGLDQAFGLEEPDLRNGDVGKLGLDGDENLTDRLIVPRRHAHSPDSKNASLNFPICTSSPELSITASTRSRLT